MIAAIDALDAFYLEHRRLRRAGRATSTVIASG